MAGELWLISYISFWNVLHARIALTKCNLKNEECILSGVLLMILHKFVYHTFIPVHQNSDQGSHILFTHLVYS